MSEYDMFTYYDDYYYDDDDLEETFPKLIYPEYSDWFPDDSEIEEEVEDDYFKRQNSDPDAFSRQDYPSMED